MAHCIRNHLLVLQHKNNTLNRALMLFVSFFFFPLSENKIIYTKKTKHANFLVLHVLCSLCVQCNKEREEGEKMEGSFKKIIYFFFG
jgi:hypothetical protein